MAGPIAGALTLPRSRRIKQRRDFTRIRTEGGRLARGCLVANWQVRTNLAPSRMAVITSRRIGSAVQRSRVRRLIREAFRLHQLELKNPLDLVLIARPSIAGKSFHEVEADFLAVLHQGKLLKATA